MVCLKRSRTTGLNILKHVLDHGETTQHFTGLIPDYNVGAKRSCTPTAEELALVSRRRSQRRGTSRLGLVF